ncbi:hypothetical protein VTG60DRAFT_1491 [Thermothelomyces hinnuleus]
MCCCCCCCCSCCGCGRLGARSKFCARARKRWRWKRRQSLPGVATPPVVDPAQYRWSDLRDQGTSSDGSYRNSGSTTYAGDGNGMSDMVDGFPVESTGTRPSISRNDAGAWNSPCVSAYSGWAQRSSAALRLVTSGSPYVSSGGVEGDRPRSWSTCEVPQYLVMASQVGRSVKSVTVRVFLSGVGGPDPGGMRTLGSSRWLTKNFASGRAPGRSPNNVLNRSPVCLSNFRTGWLQLVSAVAPEKEQSHRSMPAVSYASSTICATSLPLSLQNGETDSKIISNSSMMGD